MDDLLDELIVNVYAVWHIVFEQKLRERKESATGEMSVSCFDNLFGCREGVCGSWEQTRPSRTLLWFFAGTRSESEKRANARSEHGCARDFDQGEGFNTQDCHSGSYALWCFNIVAHA